MLFYFVYMPFSQSAVQSHMHNMFAIIYLLGNTALPEFLSGFSSVLALSNMKCDFSVRVCVINLNLL